MTITVEVEIAPSTRLREEAEIHGDTLEEAVLELISISFPSEYGAIEEVTA